MTTAIETPLGDMSKAELQAVYVAELGSDPPKKLTRMLLIAAIHESRAQDVEDVTGEQELVNTPDSPSRDERSAEDASGEVPVEDAPTLAEVERDEARMMIARREPAAPPTALPSAAEWEASMAMASSIAATQFVPMAYRNKPDEVLAAILAGRELGIGPMQALRDIHMIEGRPALAAHLQLAMLRRGGIQILSSESTDKRAVIHARRKDTGEEATVEWTLEEADRAGLTSKNNWRGYPADMLWSRCVGRLTRRLGSDLVAGMPYTAEEVADFDLENEGASYKVHERETIRETRRDHEPTPPKTWAEIAQWADAYGESLGWGEWVRDAAQLLYGTRELGDLPVDEKRKLSIKAASAIYKLRQEVDANRIPPPTRDEVAASWSHTLDGIMLPGPEWRMSPDEDRPTYESLHSTDEPPAEDPPADGDGGNVLTPEEQAEVDAIAFGGDEPVAGA